MKIDIRHGSNVIFLVDISVQNTFFFLAGKQPRTLSVTTAGLTLALTNVFLPLVLVPKRTYEPTLSAFISARSPKCGAKIQAETTYVYGIKCINDKSRYEEEYTPTNTDL